MAQIHVIYDPKNRLQVPSTELLKSTGVSVAVIAVPDEFQNDDEIHALGAQLVGMVLKHHYRETTEYEASQDKERTG